MITRKHVIRSGFSAVVSLPLIGVGHRSAPLHTEGMGQVSPTTVATRIISGRRGPTPAFFPTWTARSSRIPSYLVRFPTGRDNG